MLSESNIESDRNIIHGWIDAMLKDLRQVLNSPWLAKHASSQISVESSYKTGPNFVANATVMIAIEAIGRLATGKERGLDAAVTFVKEYFPEDYHGCIELVWQLFRNGHAHNYLPNQVFVADAMILGQVMWIDPTPEISELESNVETGRATFLASFNPGHLQLKQEVPNQYAFSFYPQIAYVDLVFAIKKWRQCLENDTKSTILFSQGILRSKDARSTIYSLDSPIGKFLKDKQVI